jgi:cytochrome c oxidase subunit 1
MGMPRRVYTYQPEMGWDNLNLTATAGALLLFISFVVFLINVLWTLRVGEMAGDNPWDAGTLEWATSSPPPPYNFSYIPAVTHREPLWASRDELPVIAGLSARRREVLITDVAEAQPQVREASPDPSIWPLLSAIAVTILFIWSIFSPWGVVWGAIPVAAALIGWFWPKDTPEDEE